VAENKTSAIYILLFSTKPDSKIKRLIKSIQSSPSRCTPFPSISTGEMFLNFIFESTAVERGHSWWSILADGSIVVTEIYCKEVRVQSLSLSLSVRNVCSTVVLFFPTDCWVAVWITENCGHRMTAWRHCFIYEYYYFGISSKHFGSHCVKNWSWN
jgi:hypothetical protein